jgi:hypothetical protein
MGQQKSNDQFLNQLKSIWGDEFQPLEEYKGHNQPIELIHKPCSRKIMKTPRNLLMFKYGCRDCKAKKNGLKLTKDSKWFIEMVHAKAGDEFEIRSPYIKCKEPIIMFHKTCKQTFETTPDTFLGNRKSKYLNGNCPYCSKCRKKTTEDFKKEVQKLYKDEFTVIGTYQNNKENIDIVHNICGNTLSVRPTHFLSQNSYCTYCNKNYKKSTEEFKAEVYKLVNDEYKVIGTYTSSRSPITLKHTKCKNEYTVSPDNFLRGRRCPFCLDRKWSKGVTTIFNFLIDNNIPFDTEFRDPQCKNIRCLPFDFVIYSNWKLEKVELLIEYDGEQHDKPTNFFGGKEQFLKLQANEKIKKKYARTIGIPLVRFSYKQQNNLINLLIENLNRTNINKRAWIS